MVDPVYVIIGLFSLCIVLILIDDYLSDDKENFYAYPYYYRGYRYPSYGYWYGRRYAYPYYNYSWYHPYRWWGSLWY